MKNRGESKKVSGGLIFLLGIFILLEWFGFFVYLLLPELLWIGLADDTPCCIRHYMCGCSNLLLTLMDVLYWRLAHKKRQTITVNLNC